jgi:hypothetical protein
MSFHTPRTDDVEGQSDAPGLRSMGISHASIACMRITLKKPRLTAEMPAFVTYRINRFSLPFPNSRQGWRVKIEDDRQAKSAEMCTGRSYRFLC